MPSIVTSFTYGVENITIPIVLQTIGLIFILKLIQIYYSTPFLQHLLKEFITIIRSALFSYKYERSLGFIITEDDITADWLENTLNNQQCFSTPVSIKSIRISLVGEDSGNASTIYRIYIEFKNINNCTECPSTMMLKLPKNSLFNKVIFSSTRMYEMEVCFYAYIQEYFPLASAKHYASAYCKTGGGLFYILMQDLNTIKDGQKKVEFVRENDSCDTNRALNVVTSLAQFHATFWNSPPDFIIPQNEPRLTLTGVAMKGSWNKFVSRLHDRLPQDILKRGLSLHKIALKIQDRLSTGPQTITHGDCHLENMFFIISKQTKDGVGVDDKVGLYDWQLMRRGRGMLDIANFIAGSLTIDEETHGLEAFLVGIYVDKLKNLGIMGYTHEDAWLDYRLSVVMLFIWNVSAAMAVPFDTSGADDYDTYILRICNCVVRHGLIDVALSYVDECENNVNKLPLTLSFPGEASHELIEPRIDLHVTKHTPPRDRTSCIAMLKHRIACFLTSSKGGHHGQGSDDRSELQLESCHDVDWAKNTDGEDHAFDSYYISGFNGSIEMDEDGIDDMNDGVSFAIRLCRRTNRESGEVWVILDVPGIGIVMSPLHPTTIANVMELKHGKGVKVEKSKDSSFQLILELHEPMDVWKVTLEGILIHKDYGTEYEVKLQGTWTATGGMFAFGKDLDPLLTAEGLSREKWSGDFFKELRASHQEHYEQFGITDGTLEIRLHKSTNNHRNNNNPGWDIFPIHACGMRDRAWGIRDWAYLSRYCSMYFWAQDVENDEMWHFNISLVSLPTMTHLKTGSVERIGIDDKPRSIESCTGSLPLLGVDGTPPQRFQFGFKSKDGYRYQLQSSVELGNTIGLDMGPDRFFVNVRLTNFTIHTIHPVTNEIRTLEGYGGSEFGYRRKGVVPYRPTEIVGGKDPTLH